MMLAYLEISAHTRKNSIGIQKQATKIPMIRINFKAQPASCTITAQLFLGRIEINMITWKRKREKVILKTADVPKQAVADSSLYFDAS